jgi:DNA-binding transcriptional LysR family regulator
VELTPHGRALVEKARAMLDMNDEVFRLPGSSDLPAPVRLALNSSFAVFFLSRTLEVLRSTYPHLLVEVTDGLSCQIAPRVKDDAFDLVVSEGSHIPRDWPSTEVWRGPFRWITSIEHDTHLRDPLPLCLTPGDCPWRPPWMDDCYWRRAPLRTLERAGRRHRIVASANSMEGLYAPVISGEAVTVSLGAKLPAGLRVVADHEGLPNLPDCTVVIIKSRNAPQPLTDIVARTILNSFSLSQSEGTS